MATTPGKRYRSRYEGLTDQQLANQLRLAVLRNGPLGLSRDWMRACFDSWYAARLRSRERFTRIAATHLQNVRMYQGWTLDDWQALCRSLGASGRQELAALDPKALDYLRWLDSKATKYEERILPRLWPSDGALPSGYRVVYRVLPLLQLVAYIKEAYPGCGPEEVGRQNEGIVRAIRSREDWPAICYALAWKLRGAKDGCFGRRYGQAPLAAAEEIKEAAREAGWDRAGIMRAIANLRRPLLDREIIQLTFPEASTIGARAIQAMTSERAMAMCTRIGAGDEEILKARLPRLWAWVRRQSGPDFWKTVGQAAAS